MTLGLDYFYQFKNAGDASPKIPVFIVGCQRSGKTMLLSALGRSPDCRVYHEGNGTNAAYDIYRLRSDEVVRTLISESRRRIVAFDPGLDSQNVDRLLGLKPHAKAIWIYRNYEDVVRSAVAKWGGNQRDIIRGIAAGVKKSSKDHQTAIAEGMDSRTSALIKQLSHEDMSAEDGSALLWFARNMIYFNLRLENDGRVLLVKFEDLVTKPDRFRRVFEFIGCPFSPKYLNGISGASSLIDSKLVIAPEINRLCQGMMERLNERYSFGSRGSLSFGEST